MFRKGQKIKFKKNRENKIDYPRLYKRNMFIIRSVYSTYGNIFVTLQDVQGVFIAERFVLMPLKIKDILTERLLHV